MRLQSAMIIEHRDQYRVTFEKSRKPVSFFTKYTKQNASVVFSKTLFQAPFGLNLPCLEAHSEKLVLSFLQNFPCTLTINISLYINGYQ